MAVAGRKTILVVDDDEQVRGITRRMLEASGYTVVTTAHGDEALLHAEEMGGRFDLLLTDVVMPHLSGDELAGILSRLYAEPRVLYMTGYLPNVPAQPRDHARCAILRKPFTADMLLSRVSEVLGAPVEDTHELPVEVCVVRNHRAASTRDTTPLP